MRDEIIDAVQGMGVSVNVHFVPLPMLTLFRNNGYHIDGYPGSYDKFSREISLPLYPQLTDEEVDYVVSAVVRAYGMVIGKGAEG
jgi:dTDP-4-amino-4,6-dideoxygalactose transaminase